MSLRRSRGIESKSNQYYNDNKLANLSFDHCNHDFCHRTNHRDHRKKSEKHSQAKKCIESMCERDNEHGHGHDNS